MGKFANRIADVRVTPIAFADPPLLNNAGCHQPFALRSIIEVETEAGVVGLGESYGTTAVLAGLNEIAPQLVGLEITDINGLITNAQTLTQTTAGTTNIGVVSNIPRVVAAFEVAMLDALGKSIQVRVCDLLGGQVRERVSFSAYLFYKFGRHFGAKQDDAWGEALSPEGLVEQAQRMMELYGFAAIKLKGGILAPEEEIAGLEALRAAFPQLPLRIDPNGGWSVATTKKLLPRLDGLVQYLEDPVDGLDNMATIQAATTIPLATNMCVVANDHLAPAIQKNAVKVILADHHYWGGLRASQHLAHFCQVHGLGLSMHSNSHLGISLAAMTHLAVATPNLDFDCDTHYPWQEDEVITLGRLQFSNGSLTPPPGPGLGVTLDQTELRRLHQNYLECGIKDRDDETELQKHWPDWQFARPRY